MNELVNRIVPFGDRAVSTVDRHASFVRYQKNSIFHSHGADKDPDKSRPPSRDNP